MELLNKIKDDEGLFASAMKKNRGVKLGELVPEGVVRIIADTGVMVPVVPGSSNYCFSDMMRGTEPNDNFTKTCINALQSINYSLPIPDLREFVKMAIISETGKEFAVPDKKTMYHIIEQGVIPLAQQATLIPGVNNSKKFGREGMGPERVIILNSTQTLANAIADIRAKDANAIIDVALSDESHIGAIEDANIKKAVFKTESDFIQLEGVIKVLRALYEDDPLPMLLQLYSVMAGGSPEGSLSTKSGVYVFNLPRIKQEDINYIANLNKGLLEVLVAA